MNGYNLTTIVWGENFVDNFIDFIIPSLLTEGNIPYLNTKTKIFYQIFTNDESINKINNSKNFKELLKYCNVFFDTTSIEKIKKEGKKDKYEITNICLSKSIKIANTYSNPWVRVQPDCLQAKNNFLTLHSLIKKNYRVIFYPMGLKVSKKILIELDANYRKGNTLDIENTDLVYLSMKYAVKKEEYKIFNNYRPKNFQQCILWTLGDRGYLERAINAGELICINPTNKNIDYKFKSISIEASDYLDEAVPNYQDWIFIRNSNDFVTCGIEEGVEEGNQKFLKKKIKSMFLNKPSKFALALANNNMNHSKMLKNSFLNYPIRYSSSRNDKIEDKEWIKIEKKTRFYAAQVILITKILSSFPVINKFVKWYININVKFYEKPKHSKRFSKYFNDYEC